MASIRHRNGRFQVQVRMLGQTKSATFLSRIEANKWATLTEASLIGSEDKRFMYKPDFVAEILQRYLTGESRQNKGHEVEKYIIGLMLKEKWALMPIQRLSVSTMAEYRDRRLEVIKPSSFNRQFSVLKVACAVAKDEWLWDFDNRFLNIRRARVNSLKIPRRVSDDEFNGLISACAQCKSEKMRHLLTLAIETGMRRGELCSLDKRSICFSKGLINIESTKTGFARVIPMTVNAEEAALALSQLSSNNSLLCMTPNAVRMSFERVRARAQLGHIRFHDFRHEAISRFFEIGLTPPEVASISGHRTLSMLMRYSHASLDAISSKFKSNNIISKM